LVSAGGSGYRLEVTRAIVTRPGLATPFRVDVSTEDGASLPEMVTLVVDADYLAIFDFNGLQPTPSTTFSRDRSTFWTFDIPPGQASLRVEMDARLEPAVQWARTGSVTLSIEGHNRLEGHRDLEDLDYAVLETDGKFSFIPARDGS
jgi:hypothetical protein